jgi:hypothetical protein
MNGEWPRDARVSEDDSELYDELIESIDSPFSGWEKNQLFIFAAAFGCEHGSRTALDGASHALFNWESLSDSQLWIIKSIVVKELEEPDVLDNGSKVDTITREFATGGINRLYRIYNSPSKGIFTQLTEEVVQKANI